MSRHIAGRGRAGRGPADLPPQSVECDLSRKLTLGQFLKLANLIDSGAEAKDVIAAGSVHVNGEVDTRRGRGLTEGDVVALGDARAQVVAG